MFTYLVLARPDLHDMKAAVDLFRETCRAQCLGNGYGLGLVYRTDQPVSDSDAEVLGVVEWR